MKRLLWLGVGLAVGALALRAITRKAQAFTPRRLAHSARPSAGGLAQNVRGVVDDLRAASVQKCLRTPDIDEVGKTSRHGTFFQMNGNFSFGDYFKEEAIKLAWELSTNSVDDGGFGLDADKIWATVYLDDDEAIDIWRRTGLPAARIVRRG